VPTRSGTWIKIVNFYSELFETVKSIVAKLPSEYAVSGRESQSAFSNPIVACSIAYIRSNFGWLLDSIKHLETRGLPVLETTDIMKNASEKLSVVEWEAGESVSTKLQAMLKRNPGFWTFISVCQVLNGVDVDPP
jgi:hypothetical protein